MRSMQQQLGNLGNISAFAYRHRETKKNLCRGGRLRRCSDHCKGVCTYFCRWNDAQRGHNRQTASAVNGMLSSALSFLIHFNSRRRLMSCSACFFLLCLTLVYQFTYKLRIRSTLPNMETGRGKGRGKPDISPMPFELNKSATIERKIINEGCVQI